jgi:hypothetical protein
MICRAQFEPKMKKLCTNEVGRSKCKKNEKKKGFCNSKKPIFFIAFFFLAAPLALHFKDDL